MSETKRYYWLKLPENFFDATDDETISFIEEQEGGSAYVLFYLKLLCKALRTDGTLIRLIGNRYVPYDEKPLSKLTNTPVDTVRCAVSMLKEVGLLKQLDSGELYLTQINEFVGSETNKAVAMRKTRAKNRLEGVEALPMKAKSNAERQRAYRAKQYVEKQPHVPFIEDHQNKIRYNGNYYIVFRRDDCKCAMCGSTDNLCVHHIDGYDEEKPENSNENKMVTLCRSCHIQVHRSGLTIPENILERIGYYDSNESNEDALPDCYPDVTQSKRKSKEKELENREEELEKELDTEEGALHCNTVATPVHHSDVDNKKSKNSTTRRKVSLSVTDDTATELMEDTNISEPLRDKVHEWLQYKSEIGDKYKTTGFKTLLKQVEQAEQKHGATAVMNQIDVAMASTWHGMFLEKIQSKSAYGNNKGKKNGPSLDLSLERFENFRSFGS